MPNKQSIKVMRRKKKQKKKKKKSQKMDVFYFLFVQQ